MKDSARDRWLEHVAAVAAAVVATGIRYALDPLFGDQLPYITYFCAVMFAAWYGGRRPGATATIVSAAAAIYFFIPPRLSFRVDGAVHVVGLLTFVIMSAVISALSGSLRAAQRRSLAAEREAEVERRRLQITLAGIGDAVIAVDVAGRVTFLNAVAADLIGRAPAAAIGRPLEEVFRIVNEQTREPTESPVQKVLREGRIVGLANHTVLLRDDGRETPIDDSAAPIRNERDEIVGVVMVFRDVGSRRAAERRRAARLVVTQALNESRDLREAASRILSALCESLGWDVGALWRLDADRQLLHCVEVCPASRIVVPRFEALSRELSFKPGVGLPGRVWQQGDCVWINDVVYDQNFPRAKTADEEGLHAAFGCPVRLGDEFLGVIEFFSRSIREPDADLLEMMSTVAAQIAQFVDRMRSEGKLRRQSERLRLLWEAAAIVVTADNADAMMRGLFDLISSPLRLDLYCHFVPADGAAELRLESYRGFPEEEARRLAVLPFGTGISGAAAVERREIVVGRLLDSDDPRAQIAKRNGVRSYVALPLAVGDRLIGTLSFGSRSRDEFDAEDLELLRVIARYVTSGYERLRLIDELKEGDRRKDEFLAVLAHELRNPLAPIRNASQIMRRSNAAPADVEWARDVIERQLDQMTRLIDDLLDVSRITRSRLQLRLEQVTLNQVVETAVEAVRPLVESLGHELIVELPLEPVSLHADLTRLAQVVANLLNNAAKYSERGGRIHLSARCEGDVVAVRVKDSGIGIPPNMLARIFDMFTQADASLEKSHGGLGIGLTLVKRLTEMHGGTVEARSDGPGQGSEFTLRLPVVKSVAQPAGERKRREPPVLPAKLRILVADDNADAADTLASLLKMMGNDVRTASDGAAAVAAACDFQPQVAVLDIGMPKLNGYDAARRLKADPRTADALLIAVTGWGQEDDVRRAKEAGFDLHLVKPVDPVELLRHLAQIAVAK